MLITALYVSLLLHSGLTVVVLQSGDQVLNRGVTVTLMCSMGQGLSMTSYTMFWYRQKHHRAPIEFLRKEHDTTVGHFQSSIDASKNNFTLQITDLQLNDSSTYYCAAIHSDVHTAGSHTNTISHDKAKRKELWFGLIEIIQ
ncbi:hypothetical protein INR49_028300, partial [Caranx melampygus]